MSKKKRNREPRPEPTPSAAPPPPPATPSGFRAAWLINVLVFLVFSGLPWTSCNRLGPVSAAIQLTLSHRVTFQLWGIAAALVLVLLAGVAALETAGRPYRNAGRVVAFAIVAVAGSEGVFFFRNRFLMENYRALPLWALRVGVFLPVVTVLAWAYRRRSENVAPVVARYLTAHSLVAMTLAWTALLNRSAATCGFLAATSLLVLALFVADRPSALPTRTRNLFAAGSVAWLAALTYITFLGRIKPRFLQWPLPGF